MPNHPWRIRLAIIVLAAVASAQAQITPTFNDVLFAVVPTDAGGVDEQRMDIYVPPTGAGPFPCVMWIHGGGWQSGTYQNVPPAILALRNQGFVVVSASYRLSFEAIFPAQIHDVKGAVRFLRANAATFSIDPRRIAAWGASAGGHLVALLGAAGNVPALEGSSGGNLGFSSRVQVVVDYFGPTDLLNMQLDITDPPGSGLDHDAANSPESRLVGWDEAGQGIGDIRANLSNPNAPYPELVQRTISANPISWIDASDPPMFIGHGDADRTVPLHQSTRLDSALAAVGVNRQYVIVPGAGHGGIGSVTDPLAVAFIIARIGAEPIDVLGDLNCDGLVSVGDISGFVLALTNPTQYRLQFPGCDALLADMNQDGVVSVGDIAGFVALLTSAA
ncbi:MAG: alpha/beta fold hydrolase [Phycisphaerae bacterium]|nr:alpha/beta fold hydrolase [Phycisphaerae bacterium]